MTANLAAVEPHTASRVVPLAVGSDVDPDTDPDAAVVVDLGPDWAGIRSFAASMGAVVLGGPVVGHAVAGPAGTVIGAGAVAACLFVWAHVWAWLRTRRVDAYATTAPAQTLSVAAGPAGWAWFCDTCRTVSVEASSPAEALDLATVHDGLHHGRPTARVTRAALTREPA
ncbi:hypothetical protein [Kineosporia sp. A_224]|uniref:hypothetical protein n=1 Tax=Kineosporia sp. A_224 TaxID=1962180 RepID=UPI000B4B1BB3|nr:hypothetical protein [Kineosporia sp. A_224]